MTGAEHYEQAERDLAVSRQRSSPDLIALDLAAAQAHATLALAAATARPPLRHSHYRRGEFGMPERPEST